MFLLRLSFRLLARNWTSSLPVQTECRPSSAAPSPTRPRPDLRPAFPRRRVCQFCCASLALGFARRGGRFFFFFPSLFFFFLSPSRTCTSCHQRWARDCCYRCCCFETRDEKRHVLGTAFPPARQKIHFLKSEIKSGRECSPPPTPTPRSRGQPRIVAAAVCARLGAFDAMQVLHLG